MYYRELKMFAYNFVIVLFLVIGNTDYNIKSENMFEIKQEVCNLNYKFSHNEISFTPDVIFDHYKESVDSIIWENREGIFKLKIREGERAVFYSTKYFNNINIMDFKNLDPNFNYIIEVESGEPRKVLKIN